MTQVERAIKIHSGTPLTSDVLQIVLQDNIEMSIVWGPGTYSGTRLVEVRFYRDQDVVLRPDFEKIVGSGDGAGTYGWVTLKDALTFAAANVKEN